MPRIEPIARDQATGTAQELLVELATRGGEPGPMVRAMANAPALLRAYLDTDEQIAEVVGLVSLQLLTGGLNLVAGIGPAPEDLSELTSRTAA